MKIVGMAVCGQGEADRYLEGTLKELNRLCDQVVVACNNVSQKEIRMIEEYGFDWYDEPREWGKLQSEIKTDLFKRLDAYNPDWVVALDCDEVFDESFTREEAEKLASKDEISYKFFFVQLWDNENTMMSRLNFWNVRFYKYMPELGTQFLKKNVHCGLAPPVMYHYAWHAPIFVKHYGLMDSGDRERKLERYQQYDPITNSNTGMWREYYDVLKSHHRPSPAIVNDNKPVPFDIEATRRRLMNAPECQDRNKKIMPKLTDDVKKFVEVKRVKDGKSLTITHEEWARIQSGEGGRTDQFELVKEIDKIGKKEKEAKKSEEPEKKPAKKEVEKAPVNRGRKK